MSIWGATAGPGKNVTFTWDEGILDLNHVVLTKGKSALLKCRTDDGAEVLLCKLSEERSNAMPRVVFEQDVEFIVEAGKDVAVSLVGNLRPHDFMVSNDEGICCVDPWADHFLSALDIADDEDELTLKNDGNNEACVEDVTEEEEKKQLSAKSVAPKTQDAATVQAKQTPQITAQKPQHLQVQPATTSAAEKQQASELSVVDKRGSVVISSKVAEKMPLGAQAVSKRKSSTDIFAATNEPQQKKTKRIEADNKTVVVGNDTKPEALTELATKETFKAKRPSDLAEKTIEGRIGQRQTEQIKKAANTSRAPAVCRELPGGVKYDVLATGAGKMASVGRNVKVKYEGRLARNGNKFDAGNLDFTIGSGDMIKGFDLGVRGEVSDKTNLRGVFGH